MKWYETWFDSKYYHILYKNRNHKEAEKFIDNLILKLKINTNHKIIDVGCGRGRHCIYFNKLGFEVTGIDLSKKSIDFAKKNETNNLKFFVHDMRKDFANEKYDIATNLFTSFGYFQNEIDNQKTINAINNNLKIGGILILDFMNINKVKKTLKSQEILKIDGINFYINKKITKSQIIKNISFKHENKNYSYEERVQLLSINEFTKLINNSKMKIVDVFGDYQLKKYNNNTSERLILICKK